MYWTGQLSSCFPVRCEWLPSREDGVWDRAPSQTSTVFPFVRPEKLLYPII